MWLSNSANALFRVNLLVFCYLVHCKKRNIEFSNVVSFVPASLWSSM